MNIFWLLNGIIFYLLKQIKWVQAVEFVESFEKLGSGQGSLNEDYEFFDWRAPI